MTNVGGVAHLSCMCVCFSVYLICNIIKYIKGKKNREWKISGITCVRVGMSDMNVTHNAQKTTCYNNNNNTLWQIRTLRSLYPLIHFGFFFLLDYIFLFSSSLLEFIIILRRSIKPDINSYHFAVLRIVTRKDTHTHTRTPWFNISVNIFVIPPNKKLFNMETQQSRKWGLECA